MAKAVKSVVEEQAESADLVVMASVNPLAVFTDREQFSQFYQKLKAETDKHTPDVSTDRGRAAVRSLAFKVTKAKTTLDKAGLALTEEWRVKTASVNAARKEMVTELDRLAEEVRRPLTEWEEAEKARVARCRETIDRMKAAAVVSLEDTSESVRGRGGELWKIEIGEEFGDLADEAKSVKETAVATLQRALERLLKEEEDRAELERLRAAEAERAAKEAEEREERERAERERIAAEQEEQRRREAEEAEARRIREAEERAAQAARDEEARKAREAEEERQREHDEQIAEERRQREVAEQAAQEERDRREAEEKRQREEAEAARQREANRAHRNRIQKAAKEAMMTCGADEDTARKIVLAIIAGEIPAVSLKF